VNSDTFCGFKRKRKDIGLHFTANW